MQASDSVIIEFSNEVLDQMKLVENLKGVTESISWFLKTLISAATKVGVSPDPEDSTRHDKTLITRSQIIDFIKDNPNLVESKLGGTSPALFSRRLKDLQELGVCQATIYTVKEHKKKLHLYTINDLYPLASLPPLKAKPTKKSRRTKSLVVMEKDYFAKDLDAILLKDPEQLPVFIHQQIFNGILDAAMRVSQKDDRRKIQVTYTILNNPLIITTTCSSDENSEIAVLTDQKAMRPLMAYCRKEIARRKATLIAQHGNNFIPSMVPNHFRLDINDLILLMNNKVSTANIEIAVAMMRRLADTTFEVDARDNPWFKERFSMMSGGDGSRSDIFEYRFIHNLEIGLDHQYTAEMFATPKDKLRPRYYTFSLDSRLFYSLLMDDTSSLFLSHRELSEENSGVLQRLYNWLRLWLTSTTEFNVSQKWYSIDDMHQKLLPSVRFDNFRLNFIRAMEKKSTGKFIRGDSGSSYVYGFYCHYKWEDDVEWFRFERDKNDHIVGDNSTHNILKRHSLLVDLSGDEAFG